MDNEDQLLVTVGTVMVVKMVMVMDVADNVMDVVKVSVRHD